jgi:hypothetical protein
MLTMMVNRKQVMADFMKGNYWGLILLFGILYFLIIYVDRNFLLQESIYYNSLSERFSDERITSILAQRESLSGWAYPILLLILIIKTWSITLLILMGLEIMNIKIPTRYLFLSVIVSEYVFLIEDGIRSIYLTWIEPIKYLHQYTDFNLRNSVVVFFEKSTLAEFLIRPLSYFNLFQVISIVTMTFIISCFTQKKFDSIFTPVFISYTGGLFLWVTLLTFLSVGL